MGSLYSARIALYRIDYGKIARATPQAEIGMEFPTMGRSRPASFSKFAARCFSNAVSIWPANLASSDLSSLM